MNTKGQTMSGWFEGIVLTLGIILLVVTIIGGMNTHWGATQETDFGISSVSTAENELESFENENNKIQEQFNQGEFSFVEGIVVIGTIGSIVKSILTLLFTIITGTFLKDILSLLNFPSVFTTIIQIIWTGSIIFILIKLIFKIKP